MLNTIRGKTYEEALIILEYLPHRACEPILKALVSVMLLRQQWDAPAELHHGAL